MVVPASDTQLSDIANTEKGKNMLTIQEISDRFNRCCNIEPDYKWCRRFGVSDNDAPMFVAETVSAINAILDKLIDDDNTIVSSR